MLNGPYGYDHWDQLLSQIPSHQLSDLAKNADSICQRAALISRYAEHRGGNGCSDLGHQKALNKAQAVLKKVRKALGYTFP